MLALHSLRVIVNTMSKEWHVMDGVGERILSRISDDVRLWNLNEGHLSDLATEVAVHELTADPISKAIDRAAESGFLHDLDKIADDLSEEERKAIVLAQIGKQALARSKGLERGTGFGQQEKKARIRVLDHGVAVRRGIIEEGHQIHILGRTRRPEPGAVIAGKVWRLEGRPPHGGILRLENWGTTVVTGLVNPVTGEPRVQLELLAKG
jgi:hypothetical protein